MSKVQIVGMGEAAETEELKREIVTEDFYVPEDDLIAFEVAPKPSFEVELHEAQEAHRKQTLDSDTEEKRPQEAEEQLYDEKPAQNKEDLEHPESDFFDQPVPEDEDQKKVVEEIAGMTEVSEDMEAQPQPPEEREAKTSVQIKEPESVEEQHIEDVPRESKASVLFRPDSDLRKRPSFIQRLRTSVSTSRSVSAKSSAEDVRYSSDPRQGRRSEFDPSEPSSVRGSIKTLPKESIIAGRKRETISYAELGPRIRGLTEDEDLLTGFDIGGDLPFMLDEVIEEEEEKVPQEEEQMPVLDRKPYYERHDRATEEIAERKVRNFILQKLLAMYFRRKKMEYVTKETDWSFDQQTKYSRKLEAYGELMDFEAQERIRENLEIAATRKEREDKFNQLTTMFKKMQSREAEIGYGLINTKTGNVIPDKHVERLIHRQFVQMGQVCSMRLTYLRLRQMVQEKLDAIADLDEIAPGFRLADYEQLKIMNQSYADKIEEKDEELTRLRAKCASTIQILAHLREKSLALENDVEDFKYEHEETDANFFMVRSNLNSIKQQRDSYRHSLNKLRDESGLLTQPTLLKDMAEELNDVKVLTTNLETVMKDYKKRANQIKIIRKKIEQAKENRRPGRSMARLRSLGGTPVKSKSTIYRGRPSLMMPIIEDSAFDSLSAIEPKITYDRRRYHLHVKHNKRKEG